VSASHPKVFDNALRIFNTNDPIDQYKYLLGVRIRECVINLPSVN
jgi:hypothetical protein